MDKKEFNFLLDLYKKQSGEEPTTEKEISEISKYLSRSFNTIHLKVNKKYVREKDLEEDKKDNKNTHKKRGKGYKKKHKNHVKKKRFKSKKWNRY